MSYVYYSDGTVQSKTDAKGVRAEFSYDAYARVTQTRRVANSVEDRCQRADYFYDDSDGRLFFLIGITVFVLADQVGAERRWRFDFA